MADREQQNGKRNGKKNQKRAGDQETAKVQQPRFQKPAKPKGQVPDFTPHAERVALERLQVERTSGRLDDMVQGMPGTYYVGTHDDKKVIKAFEFDVTLREDRAFIEDEDGIYIPLDYLFEMPVLSRDKFHCYLAHGKIGDLQFQMLCFLQEALASEIKIQNGVRRQQHISLHKAMTETTQATTPVSNDNATVKQHPTANTRPFAEFGPKAYGRYNVTSDQFHCTVEYITENGVDMLRIRSMSHEHKLAQAGVKVGLMMCAEHLNKTCAIPVPDHAQAIEVYTHLCLFRGFMLQALDQVAAKKQRKAA